MCYNAQEAKRQRRHREQVLTELEGALKNLGFKGRQVERVMTEIRGDGADRPFEELLREALGILKDN